MMISIVEMQLCILSMMVGLWLVPPLTLATTWMDGNMELKMAGDKHPPVLLIGFFGGKSLSQRAKKYLQFTKCLGCLLLGKDNKQPITC